MHVWTGNLLCQEHKGEGGEKNAIVNKCGEIFHIEKLTAESMRTTQRAILLFTPVLAPLGTFIFFHQQTTYPGDY